MEIKQEYFKNLGLSLHIMQDYIKENQKEDFENFIQKIGNLDEIINNQRELYDELIQPSEEGLTK